MRPGCRGRKNRLTDMVKQETSRDVLIHQRETLKRKLKQAGLVCWRLKAEIAEWLEAIEQRIEQI